MVDAIADVTHGRPAADDLDIRRDRRQRAQE
jgi:hypothetical protein